MGNRKIVVYNQMLMMLILTFIGIKNGFDIFIYTSILLLISSSTLHILSIYHINNGMKQLK